MKALRQRKKHYITTFYVKKSTPGQVYAVYRHNNVFTVLNMVIHAGTYVCSGPWMFHC